ncbi:MAG: hypothetical protein IIA83_07990 [Thaumarchaeota archaeon]|nr:hypothetical protein [Nitrososphaerota archaeon]
MRRDGTPTLVIKFWALCPAETEVKLNGDSTEFAWVSNEQLGNYEFIGNVEEDIKVAMRECTAR